MVEEGGGEARLKKWMSGCRMAGICPSSQEFFLSFPCNFGLVCLTLGIHFPVFSEKTPPGVNICNAPYYVVRLYYKRA